VHHLARARALSDFSRAVPALAGRADARDSLKGSQLLQPLFEFSGACAGCGETPYLKLLTQLHGDRLLVANATGCSSIFGGNLPTTPWSQDADGRGPAWANSLFEDNAEFGLGLRLACDGRRDAARTALRALAPRLEDELVRTLLETDQGSEAGLRAVRTAVEELKRRLPALGDPTAAELLERADALAEKTVWIVGGDGWAYDIGFGGLDHVLASGRDVNVLVLDTGVYSNTGGQASKATPRAAVAKFAAGGKEVRKKDLGLIAAAYGNVYVAQIAVGANPNQTLEAFREAQSWHGPSLIIAYSHCIAHGIEMSTAMGHQREAVTSGFWPLFRYDPRLSGAGAHPFRLDSKKPRLTFADFAAKEARFAMLARANPAHAERLMAQAQADIDEQWRWYAQLAGIERSVEEPVHDGPPRARPPAPEEVPS
jgi:pyruvate-ferredoxin/flavodoxin oxidoreductase